MAMARTLSENSSLSSGSVILALVASKKKRRRSSCHSSCCSSSWLPASRTIAVSLGTMPTTLMRRLMGSFAERRSWPPADFVYIAAVMAAPQLIREINAQLPLAVALVFLGIQDFGRAHQGVDLLLQRLLGPEHPLMSHGLVLGGIGMNLRCHPAPHGQGSPSRPSDRSAGSKRTGLLGHRDCGDRTH